MKFIYLMLPLSIRWWIYVKIEEFQVWVLKNETSYFVNRVAKHLGAKE